MKLSTAEIDWVKERMKIYVIKYQEIYDEILDHIITAMEARRVAGDSNTIQRLFQDVVDDDFNGYIGIESLAISEEKIYQKNIRAMFYKKLKHHFNWKTLVGALLLLAVAYNLPNIKIVHLLFMLFMIIMAASPVIYACILLAGKTKTIKGKRSLLRTFVITQAAVPILLLNGFLYIPNLFDEAYDRKDFYIFNHTSPVILMGILLFLMIINLSYLQSCREIVGKHILSN